MAKTALPPANSIAQVVLTVGVELAEELAQDRAHKIGVVVGENVPLFVGERVVGELETGDELRNVSMGSHTLFQIQISVEKRPDPTFMASSSQPNCLDKDSAKASSPLLMAFWRMV